MTARKPSMSTYKEPAPTPIRLFARGEAQRFKRNEHMRRSACICGDLEGNETKPIALGVGRLDSRSVRWSNVIWFRAGFSSGTSYCDRSTPESLRWDDARTVQILES
jgi:hypothetical protein